MLTDGFHGSSRSLVGRIISLASQFLFCETLNKFCIQLKSVGFYKALLFLTRKSFNCLRSFYLLLFRLEKNASLQVFIFYCIDHFFVSFTQIFFFLFFFFKQLSQSNIILRNRLVMMMGVYLKVMYYLVNLFNCSVTKIPPQCNKDTSLFSLKIKWK